MRRLAPLLVLAIGCSSAAPPIEPAPLHEGAPDKEDAPALAPLVPLVPRFKVAYYTAVREELVTVDSLQGVLGGSIPAGSPIVAIRRFELDGQAVSALVDAQTLIIVVAARADVLARTRAAQPGELAGTPYFAGLSSSADHAFEALAPSALDPEQARFAITVDMCQSSREWERGLFEWLVDLGRTLGHPIPVGIAMAGRWATAHATQLNELIAWDAGGALRITWIGHSYNHPVADAQGAYTFLTDPSVDFTSEVLRLEVLLLEQGVVFSPLFRFPGLTHDAKRLSELNELSLFAIGTNAWLGKGQPITNGAVVLLHGNGNGHHWMEQFYAQMESWRPDLVSGRAAVVSALDVIR